MHASCVMADQICDMFGDMFVWVMYWSYFVVAGNVSLDDRFCGPVSIVSAHYFAYVLKFESVNGLESCPSQRYRSCPAGLFLLTCPDLD